VAKTSAVASAVGGVATLSAVAVLLSLAGTSPATPAANRPTGEVTRRDLNATVSVAGQLERTDSRAVYWQQPPPATEGSQTAAAEGSQAAAAEGSQAAAAGGSAERQTVPAQPAAAEGTVGGAGQAQPAAPPTTSTTLPRSTTSTTTSTTSTSTTSTSTTSTSTSSTTTTTTPCTTTTTAPTMASACTTTSPPTATTPPPTSDTLAVTPAAAGVSWSVAPSAATQQEDDPSTGDGQAQDEPSSANEPADDQHTVTAVAAEGQAVERGDTLFAIDGRPTVALAGTQPAYRDLEDGVDDGGDVAQLEENLAALGYDNDGQLTVDETFDADTTAAVEAWQEARGVAATGTVALGDVAFISPPTTVAATHVTVGDPVDAGGHILDVAGETVLGVGALPVRLTGEVREGSPTLVTLADGETVSGTVRSVASDATRPDGADVTESTVELTVQLDATDSPAAREGADVDLAVTTATRTGVLTVPVAAIVDAGDGQPAVRVPAGEGDDEAGQLVAVSAGVSASGYVEIADGALAEGDSMLLPGTDPEP
jgi:peptidoglycan hydrolase-like protein with peptidoglycan-binding domain